MNIQQSINQMLYTGTIAAGLYARSPAGQEVAAVKTKERGVKKAGEKTDKALETVITDELKKDPNKSVFESPIGETLEEFGGKEVEKLKELFEADPSDKNYQAYQKAKKGMEALMRSKKRHLEDKKLRMQAVEGTPEAPAKNTKGEVNTDGKK